jgi:hypothetical protein
MHILIAGLAGLAAGLIAGTLYGRNLEQKALSAVLSEFRKVDADAHAAVSRLFRTLPYLQKYLK